jgi:hypothetical protein
LWTLQKHKALAPTRLQVQGLRLLAIHKNPQKNPAPRAATQDQRRTAKALLSLARTHAHEV